MAGDRLNRGFCDSGDAAHRLSLQATDRSLLSRPMCPGERLTLNNGILRLFTSRIGTLVPVSHPHRNPFTRYTLLQGVSCGNAILRPSGDGTAHNTSEDLSNSHECAPSAST